MTLSRVMADDSRRTGSAVISIEVWPNDGINVIKPARIAVNFCSLLTVDSRSFRASSPETKFIKVTAVTHVCGLFSILNLICVRRTAQITRWDHHYHRSPVFDIRKRFSILYAADRFYLSVQTALVEKFKKKNTTVDSKRLFFFFTRSKPSTYLYWTQKK